MSEAFPQRNEIDRRIWGSERNWSSYAWWSTRTSQGCQRLSTSRHPWVPTTPASRWRLPHTQPTHSATLRSEGGACLCRFDHPPASGSTSSVHCLERADSFGTQLAALSPHLLSLADMDQGENGIAQLAPIGDLEFGLGSAKQVQPIPRVDERVRHEFDVRSASGYGNCSRVL